MPTVTTCFHARSRSAWRAWLVRHHASAREIWLVLLKRRAGKPCVGYDAAVEEALCFGWIDGILKRVDDEKHVVRFSPRRPRSVWSESNKNRVRRMIAQGRMTDAGLALVRAAKQSGQWARATENARVPRVPADLRAALAKNPRARDRFARFAPSYRRTYIGWILDAKREETRERRVREVVSRAARNRKPGID